MTPQSDIPATSGVFLMLFIACIDASNILVSPLIGKGSHFYLSAAIGEQLIPRGHNLTYLVGNAFEEHVRGSRYGKIFNYEVFEHSIPVEDIHGQFRNFSQGFSAADGGNHGNMVTLEILRTRQADCAHILENGALMDRLRDANFSVVMYDITWICAALIAEILNIPSLVVVPYPSPCFHTFSEGSGFNPAYVPSMMTSHHNVMSFKERLVNALLFVMHRGLGIQFSIKPYKHLTDQYGLSDPYDIVKRSKLWFVNSDFVGEYPCAFPPNIVPVGGLTARDPEALPSDIEEFIQGSGEDGIIVCSFGSFLIMDESNMPMIRMFLDAFSRLPQRVLWLLKTSPSVPIPAGVKILPWLPQNDILGHPKTRAIFFHGGPNSYYEAIYHGVPAVVMPVFADQFGVSNRVVHFGFGLKLNKDQVTADLIYEALSEVANNNSYSREAKRISSAFRNRPMKPAERAAFWVDYFMKHGIDHLEMPIDSLNIFQYYLLDVIIFLLSVITISLLFITKCIIVVYKRICQSARQSSLREKLD